MVARQAGTAPHLCSPALRLSLHAMSLHAAASPAAPLQAPFVPQMHPGMARDDACDRSAAVANTPAGGKFTDSYM